jgi:hypothetical protein
MGGMSANYNGSNQVNYDPETNQYYTETTPHNNMTSMFMGNLSPLQNQNSFKNMLSGKNTRNYINGFNQSSPALQQAAPYQYADISLESLFPMLQGAMQGLQGNAMQGGAGLLGSQGATGSASSGAGRFM